VQQQHPDQRPGAVSVAVPGPRPVPELLVRGGESPGGAGLGQRRRPGQRARLAEQDLQVVVKDQVLGPGGGLWGAKSLPGL